MRTPGLLRYPLWQIKLPSFSQEAYVQLRELLPNAGVHFLSREFVAHVDAMAQSMHSRIEATMKTTFRKSNTFSSALYGMFLATRVCKSIDAG